MGMATVGLGDITTVSVNQSLLSPLKLEVNPNIQAAHPQEKEQIKTLPQQQVCLFIDKVRNLEQRNEILETRKSLRQQQETA